MYYMYMLFKEPIAEKSKGKLTLMGKEIFINIWQHVMDQNLETIRHLEFLIKLSSFGWLGLKSNHVSNFNLSYVFLFCVNFNIQVFDLDLIWKH